ncbi:MAG TPA: DUF3987 domain-containing protein [Vampirovibrionales bacterium]
MNYSNIPNGLKALNQWILWKEEHKQGEKKPTKVPISPSTFQKTDPTDLSSCTSLEEALSKTKENNVKGLGFCLNSGITCIDLDSCLNDGKLETWAKEVVDLFPNAYIEISQSGKGLHVFVSGSKPFENCKFDLNNDGRVEVYDSKRFICITGDLYQGSSSQLIDGFEGLQKLYSMKKNKPVSKNETSLLDKIFSSKNGHKIKKVFDGDISDYAQDDSRADQALMCYLAFWTGKKTVLMEELFNQSELAKRNKWIEREDYRQRTIQYALDNTFETYSTRIEVSGYKTSLTEEWEDPLPFPCPLKEVIPFDLDFIPQTYQPFVQDIAERLQCPIDFPAAALVVVISSVIGRRLGIKPKQKDNWIVVPNLWGMVIGRPSIMKTPAMKQPMDLLEHLEDNLLKEYKEEKNEFERNKVVYDEMKNKQKNDVKIAIKNNKDPFSIVEKELEIPPEPQAKRLITNDSTIEKLGEILSTNPNGILYFRDELSGFIKGLERQGREADRGFYLEGWNGDGRYLVDRITRGSIYIEAVCVSILGGIQPGKLEPLVKQAVYGQTGDDGFLQRFQIAVWPDDLNNWKVVDRYPNNNAKKDLRTFISSIYELEENDLNAERDEFNPVPFLKFEPSAQKLFYKWLEPHEQGLKKKELHPAIESHLKKYVSLIPSLALQYQLAEDVNSKEVTDIALSRALAYSEYLRSHAERIYDSVLLGEIEAAKGLLRRIKKKDIQSPFTQREVLRKSWTGLSSPEMVKKVLDLLEDLKYLKVETKTGNGRPTEVYLVNSKLWSSENE